MLNFISNHQKLVFISAYTFLIGLFLFISVKYSRRCSRQIKEMNDLYERSN